jgi:type IV pilus assembly protein PilB
MPQDNDYQLTGEELVRQDIITREELEEVKAREETTGTPWYKQLIQRRRITFDTLENVLRYEFHSKAARSAHETLGETLVAMGKLRDDHLVKALAEQKRNGRLLGNILLEKGFITREAMAHALARQYGMEYASLMDTQSEIEALEAVPENLAVKQQMLPVSLKDDVITVLINSPQTRERLKEVSKLLGKRIDALLTATDDLETEVYVRYKVLAEHQARRTPTEPSRKKMEQISDKKKAVAKKVVEGKPADSKDSLLRFEEIARAAAGTSVVQMVSVIIEGAVNAGATDIHIDPQEPESRIRYRIDGVLHDVMSIPEQLHPAVVSRIKIISDLDITETRHPQDGHISLVLGDHEFDVRVATLPTFLGERVVLRLLDQASVLSGIKDLGLRAEDEKKMHRIIKQPYGMILVTGPTGSGKTTTLYAALNQKNVMTESIVTLEDPVEYQLSGINQVQIETDINVTFANTLRAAMRQDIDVLLVGEIRDPETAHIAIRAAMTGHLVFSTLHTNDAVEAVSTLRNMGVPAFLISAALTAVIGQRLVRKICAECKKPFKPSASLLKSVGLPATVNKLYRGQGCQACHFTGNKGRTGIFEVFEVTPTVRELIVTEVSADKIVQASRFSTMAAHCREKVKEGLVNPEEYLRVIRI